MLLTQGRHRGRPGGGGLGRAPDSHQPRGLSTAGVNLVATLYALRGPDKGCTYQTDDDCVVIGRKSDQIQLTDESVSRQHAEMRRQNGAWMLRDRNSSNGTYLNGRRIFGPTRLQHGDQIKVGASILVFSGQSSVERLTGPSMIRDLVDLGVDGQSGESTILSAIAASEESIVLATPQTAEQVAASNMMYQIAEMMGTDTPVEEFLERVADIIFGHLTVDRLVLLMTDKKTKELTPQVVRYRAKQRGRHTKINTSQKIISHVLKKKEGILCANAMTDDRFTGENSQDSIHRLGLRSVICVPVLTHDGVQGVFHLDCSMSHHTYTQEQLRLAVAIGRMTGLAIDNARLLESRVHNERLAATGEAVAHLSHEIRNILQGLRSGADVVEMGLDRRKTEVIKSGWQIVRRGIDRVVVLATNMLTFSKERTPRLQLAQINKIVTDVVAATQQRADEKSVMLLTELGELPAVPVDLHGLKQVALNLLLNAVEAAPEDGGRVNLQTQYDRKTQTATLAISDNGPGIEPDRLNLIFEPFYSTKGHAGTGLGLAAAKKVVHELNGLIDVESSPGEGTTFRVVLPAFHKGLTDKDKDKTHGDAK